MEEASRILTFFGAIFLLSLVVSHIARRLNIPRVTLLILTGVALGPHGLNLINGAERDWFPIITDVTLLIIGYLLGARLTKNYLSRYARGVIVAAFVITTITCVTVASGLLLLGFSVDIALILAAVAAATDPAATLDVLRERRHRGHFGLTLEGIVAMDDILGLFAFSFMLAALGVLHDDGSAGYQHLVHLVWEIGGSAVLGLGMGGLTAFLLDKTPRGHPVIVESLGFIFLCGGLAMTLDVSFLLAAMIMGIVVVNRADKTYEHLHEIEYIEQPFLVLFFVLAGATLELGNIVEIGMLGVAFVLLRIGGRLAGGFLVPLKFIQQRERPWLGLALLPQAGIAMGMALVATAAHPDTRDTVLPVAITATVVFELIGPLLTHFSLTRVENIKKR
ncbi:MAG: cation:proton antiporter [Ketobacteraceae bacterium]|nr:cation:proton antiporter [Ketobacteraceae bacterium]